MTPETETKTKLAWISIHDRVPEKYVKVLTLLYKHRHHGGEQYIYEMCMNSIQGRHIREPNGSLLDVYEWAEENLRVEYWLEGLPKLPETPTKQENNEMDS